MAQQHAQSLNSPFEGQHSLRTVLLTFLAASISMAVLSVIIGVAQATPFIVDALNNESHPHHMMALMTSVLATPTLIGGLFFISAKIVFRIHDRLVGQTA